MLDAVVKPTKLRLGIVGATGAMGRRTLAVLREYSELELAAVLTRAGGEDRAHALMAPGATVVVTASPEQFAGAIDVAVDFSAPAQCAWVAPHLARAGCAYVVASTGLDSVSDQALDDAARQVPVLQAANLSLGVQVLTALAEQAARALTHWDFEIMEAHHRRKVDGPSGTALALGAALTRGRPDLQPHTGRSAQAATGRPERELGYSVVRGGDVAGEHTIYLMGHGERLELTHRSQSADIFARGALAVCSRLRAVAPKRYTMQSLPPHKPV